MKHPGRTAAQKRVLDQMGCGEVLPRAKRQTLDRMVDEGLIVRLADRIVGRDGFGLITLPQYEMTISTHYAWCSYWAKHADLAEDEA